MTAMTLLLITTTSISAGLGYKWTTGREGFYVGCVTFSAFVTLSFVIRHAIEATR